MKRKVYFKIMIGCLLTIAGSLLAVAETPTIKASQNGPSIYTMDASSQYSSETEKAAPSSPASAPVSSQTSSHVVVNGSIDRSLTTKGQNDFHDTVFIGDSRTQGLMTCSDLSDATFYAVKGLMVSTVFTEPAIKTKSGNQTIIDALKANQFKKVYIMLGINELGWAYSSVFISKYGEVIDAIQKSQPNAKIIVQAIFPVTAKRSASDTIFNNTNIAKYNKLIQNMTLEKRVTYLDVSPALTDSSGSLSANASSDGIHLNHTYCQKWSDFLKANKE
ncbi:MAG TPA: GDSL-type esterase/lipase family protein [Oscillospiraceae bacterium]|nr:GDSL-type esterase/lipase family protein [Oscillospiraceae bacterium]